VTVPAAEPTGRTTASRHRVAFFLPALEGGGAERVTLTIAQGLAARGHEVELVLGQRRGPLCDDVPEEITVVDLGCARVSRTVGALRRHLRTHQPDVLVSALFHANVAAAVATRGLGTPLLVVEHNTMSVKFGAATSLSERLAPLACSVAYRVVDQVAAVSEGVADDLSSYLHLARNRVRVLRNPVDYAEVRHRAAEPVAHPWFDEDAAVVLAVGRLTEQKDFATLVRAIATVPEVRLLILGEGEQRAALQQLTQSLGVGDRVDLPGFVANPYPYFASADVIAMSSRWEGLPTVLLEALPFDARIVSTDCPSGPREILEGGRFGRLVPVADAQALAQAIAAAVSESPQDRSEAWARYDRPVAVSEYEAVLDELAGRRSAR
jgi:glycosyltransferase involved in cell wall biosynthesis